MSVPTPVLEHIFDTDTILSSLVLMPEIGDDLSLCHG